MQLSAFLGFPGFMFFIYPFPVADRANVQHKHWCKITKLSQINNDISNYENGCIYFQSAQDNRTAYHLATAGFEINKKNSKGLPLHPQPEKNFT